MNSQNDPRGGSQKTPDSSEMKIKPSCSCPNCHHWTTSVDWGTKPFLCKTETVANKIEKPPPLLNSRSSSETETFRVMKPEFCTKIQKQSASKVLVYGNSIPSPMVFVSEAYFHNRIQFGMKRLNYVRSTDVQSFIWPAIFRQLNVCMISGPKSGKTMAYLPAICSFALETKEQPTVLSKHRGPFVIILCANSGRCEKIFDLVKSLDGKLKVKYLTYPVTNVSGTDILITIPSVLVHCVEARMLNFKRLCHFILEDANIQLKNNEESVYTILKGINDTLNHRICNKGVQMIISSERWSSGLQSLVKQLYAPPMICITNHLEAALYGNIKFEVNFMMSQKKKDHLAGILQDKWRVCRTLILCDSDQILPLQVYLIRRGIRTICLRDSSSKEEIETREAEWASLSSGSFKVLICSDFVFDTLLNITSAMWVVHYSISATWTRFTKRFSAFSDLLKNETSTDWQCTSFLIIDETCEKQMGKILNLLKRLSKDLPANYKTYAQSFKRKQEIAKVENKIEICPSLKLFGKCSTSFCEYRHAIDNALDIANNLPKNGVIFFKIFAILDVTRYMIQIIKHVDLEGNTSDYNIDTNQFNCEIPPEFNAKPININVGHFYAHCGFGVESNNFLVCRVLKIQEDNSIEVELLTTNETLQTVKSKLRVLPPTVQTIEAYLCNLVPPFDDTNFSAKSFHVISTYLQDCDYRNLVLSGKIFLQLGNTLWLENVEETININGTGVVKFNLTKFLKNNELVECCPKQLTGLYNLCDNSDVTLPNYVKPSKVGKVETKVAHQEAFLSDNITEVFISNAISPDEFYVRLSEFSKLLANLEGDIEEAVTTGICKPLQNVCRGNYCLAPEPVKAGYARALILRVENDETLCFYVDYGDEGVVKTADIKILPGKLLRKLPFQAIQCSLSGILPVSQKWDNAAIDVLYKYMFEPETDFFRSLFVKVCQSDVVNTTTRVTYSVLLKDSINCHTLINRLLIDCGLAISLNLDEDWEDFEINPPQTNQSLDTQHENEDPNLDSSLNDFDIEIYDVEKFLNLLTPQSFQKLAIRENPEVSENPEASQNLALPEKTVPKEAIRVDYLTPEIYWSQTSKTVKLKIMLVGVSSYNVKLLKKRFLMFKTDLDGKNYEVKITLNKITELDKHFGGGQDVQIFLKKLHEEEWMQLTVGSTRNRNIHYEVTSVEGTEKQRKFLQLDVTDEESDGEIDVMYNVVSDLDSDFDEELVLSSEE